MEDAHKTILTKHRTEIVNTLDVAFVKDKLIEHGIFSPGQWGTIERVDKAGFQNTSTLMDTLPKSGPGAFSAFCEALTTSGHGGCEHLGKLLINDDLCKQINSIREAYNACTSRGHGETVVKALKNVVHCTKVRGRKESEQTVTSLKRIRDAMETDGFGKTNKPILNDILDLVEKLKNIRDSLLKDGSASKHVNKLSTLLADGADFSDLYSVTVRESSDYLKQFGMKGLESSMISKFGSVLVLVPYLCDLSEKAVQKLKEQPIDAVDVTPRTKAGRVEAVRGAEGQSEETQTQNEIVLANLQKLLDQQQEMKQEMREEMGQVKKELGQVKEELGKAEDALGKKVEEALKLKEQMELVKTGLCELSGHLSDIKKALPSKEHSEVVEKVSKLERKVQNLRDQDLGMLTLIEQIHSLQGEVGGLEASFQGDVSTAIKEILDEINQNLKAMLANLEQESRVQQILAEDMVQQIDSVKEEYKELLKTKLSLSQALIRIAGKKAVTSLTCIEKALNMKTTSFGTTETSSLKKFLALVDKLKHIREVIDTVSTVTGSGSVQNTELREVLKSKLSEEADISNLCNEIGSKYMGDFPLEIVTPANKSKIGSVLILIPYLCDISNQVVLTMKTPSSSKQAPGDHSKQTSERFQQWLRQKCSDATVKSLVEVSRNTGPPTLANRTSGISGASGGARSRLLPPIQGSGGQSSERTTRTMNPKAASGAKPKKKY